MANRIQIRRDSENNWNNINPILADGELALTYDNNKIKVGDGTNTWTSLSYSSSSTGNVTFSDQVIVGTGAIDGSGSGLYLSPGANSTANLQYLRVRGGDDSGHIHLDTGNNTIYDQFFGNDDKYLKLEAGATGNIVISTDGTYEWQFGSNGNLTLPGNSSSINYANGTSILDGLGAGGIALTDLSIGTDGTPTGSGNISYANSTGIFTYTPPVIPDVSGFALTSAIPDVSGFALSTDIPDVSGFALTSAIPDVSGFVTGTPWTSAGYLTTITNIFDQALNTTNNVTFSSVITSNVQATNGSPAVASPVAVGGAGSLLTISAGDGGIAATGVNAGAGGNLTITAGDAGSDIGNPSWGEVGGTLVIRGGNSSRPYHGSDVQIHSGNSVISPGAISLHTGTNQWTFGKTGNLTLPVGGNILDSTGTSVLGVNIFNQNLNTSNNVTFNSVITNNVHASTGTDITVAGGLGTSIPNSIVFDGSTSFMSVPASSDFAIGVTYTIEFRIYLTATSAGVGPWIIMTQEANDPRIHLLISGGKFQWNTSAGNSQRIPEPTAGQWVHVALVNTAGTQTIYYDGIEQISLNAQDGTPGYADLTNTTAPLVFGRYGSNNYQYLPAKLSGIRISKVARYPAAFTPPTEVFVSDSNTLLLMNVLASQEYIDSSSYARTITNTATTIGTIPGIGLLPGNLVASAGSHSWTFRTDGNLSIPLGGDILDSNDRSVIKIEPPFSIKTADFSAIAGGRYGVNTTSVAVTATLPASPATGIAIYFADAGGAYATNNLVIARNGQTIMGSSSNMTVNVNDQSFGLFYNGTTWRVY
jgi:hypothetical protein